MRDFAMFNFEYLFGDSFSKVSHKAKLLYINMMFYANCGFVSNPKQICSNLGFTETILDELIKCGELLTREGRAEMVMTNYFIHNQSFNPLWWTKTPYATYWHNHLWIKKNRVFTLRKPKEEKEESLTDKQQPQQEEIDITLPNSAKPQRSVLDKLNDIVKKTPNEPTDGEDEEEVVDPAFQELKTNALKLIRKRTSGKKLTLEEDHIIYTYYNELNKRK